MQLGRRYSFWELGLPFFSRDTPALFCMITWASVLWVSDVKEFCIILWSGEPSDGIDGERLRLNISLQPKHRMLKTRWIQLFGFWYAALLNKSLVLSWTLELINLNCNGVSSLSFSGIGKLASCVGWSPYSGFIVGDYLFYKNKVFRCFGFCVCYCNLEYLTVLVYFIDPWGPWFWQTIS